MGKGVLTVLILIASVLIVVSFFLPWAKVNVSAMGVSRDLSKAAEGTLKDTPMAGKVVDKLKSFTGFLSKFGDVDVKTTITGYQIPQLVNNKTSKVALSLAQIMFKSTKGLDIKSYLVYLLPIFGIICGLFAVLGQSKKIYSVLMVVISGAVGLGGLYTLYTADLPNLAIKISIEKGLWNTMFAFLFIAFIGIVGLVFGGKK